MIGMWRRVPILLLALTLPASTGCFRGGAGLFAAIAGTAIVTAVIVSSREPPPPRVVYVPDPRSGYAWQPGYWTLQDGEWLWVDGRWLDLRPGYAFLPTHWEAVGDGTWRLVPGRWVPAGGPPPPPDEPPPPPPG
jgi:hypothetical protein